VTLETIGSNCFHYSAALNRSELEQPLPNYISQVQDAETGLNLAHFDSFHSKASGSLGASQPAAQVLKMALARTGSVISASIPDELSMHAASAFSGKRSLSTFCVILF
jgi:L-serine/L-threonine ammonia-lyase